jgi:molybdopterin molybdotransferase
MFGSRLFVGSYNNQVATLTFLEARECVVSNLSAAAKISDTERIPIAGCSGRILAGSILADRDYPPLPRSVRDGFAVRASDVPGELYIIGEVRAGERFGNTLQPGQAVEIMTGAPMPDGSNAVVMVEDTKTSGEKVIIDRSAQPGDNVGPQASDARAGEEVLAPGQRLDYAAIGVLAMVGTANVTVYRQTEVAIVATGDEIVDGPLPVQDHQIRNTNSWVLAAQVARAGGKPMVLPVAPDVYAATRELIEHGLRFDLLLLSGGVSAGKYDIVERVLADLGAEFYFDRVRIQPGQPLVFGQVRGKYFFGLPGNPGSTLITFEVFARAAIELLGGQREARLPFFQCRLTRQFNQKPGLTRFLPAFLSADGSQVTPAPSSGSGDLPALARAQAFLVTEPDRAEWAEGDYIRVLLK